MKIAVTCEDNQVFPHFGHTPGFAVFVVENGKICSETRLNSGETGHGALAGLLREHDVDVLICGGIGPGAQIALADAGIVLVGGAAGNVGEVVRAFIAGTLETDPGFSCHHHHDETHSCGNGNCGAGRCC